MAILQKESYYFSNYMSLLLLWKISLTHSHSENKQTKKSDPVIIFKCIFTFVYNVFLSILILKAGDIKLNTGIHQKLSLTFLFLSLVC